MSIFSNYKIIPFSIQCDTVILCYNPYFDVKFKQCYQFKDMLSSLQQIPPTYKTALLAQTYQLGVNQISKIKKLQQARISIEDNIEYQSQKTPIINDRLILQADNLTQKIQGKTSFLHLKCLLNQTQTKISNLTKELKETCLKPNPTKIIKKQKKRQKWQQKQLKLLNQKQANLLNQIENEENLLWWHEQSKRELEKEQDEENQQCEYLLSDSQEKKENKIIV